jgi:hypothetical protein
MRTAPRRTHHSNNVYAGNAADLLQSETWSNRLSDSSGQGAENIGVSGHPIELVLPTKLQLQSVQTVGVGYSEFADLIGKFGEE